MIDWKSLLGDLRGEVTRLEGDAASLLGCPASTTAPWPASSSPPPSHRSWLKRPWQVVSPIIHQHGGYSRKIEAWRSEGPMWLLCAATE